MTRRPPLPLRPDLPLPLWPVLPLLLRPVLAPALAASLGPGLLPMAGPLVHPDGRIHWGRRMCSDLGVGWDARYIVDMPMVGDWCP